MSLQEYQQTLSLVDMSRLESLPVGFLEQRERLLQSQSLRLEYPIEFQGLPIISSADNGRTF